MHRCRLFCINYKFCMMSSTCYILFRTSCMCSFLNYRRPHVPLLGIGRLYLCDRSAAFLRRVRRSDYKYVGTYSNTENRCLATSSTGKDDSKIIIENISKEYIRNFSIIAHVDHGKSTLSDRLLEFTGTILKSNKNEQVLDKLQVERERGITVKAQSASMLYTYKGQTYLLNLVDTPGHVDFSYEVARSLAACQGAILLVDANQGIQAQTVANFNLAFLQDLTVLPVLNKIDLKNAKPEAVSQQMQKLFEIDPEQILKVSAKLGTGVQELIEAVIQRIPSPPGNESSPLRALSFDSWYDVYRGVINLVAVVDGRMQVGDEIVSTMTGKSYVVRELGVLRPEETPLSSLNTGQTGYVVANMRDVSEAKLGDTFSHKDAQVDPLPAIEVAKPMVFAGIFPVDQSQNIALKNAVQKLALNDPSVTLTLDSSPALGQGWRLGFLGLLHMEVFCQRLEQEFDAPVVVTTPSVPYIIKLKGEKQKKLHGSEEIIVSNPLKFPEPTVVSEYLEPIVIGTIITPENYFGTVSALCMERRGVQKNTTNIDADTLMMQYKFPLSEVIVDFFDELKSLTSGYASFDYEECGYETTDIVKIDILLNKKVVEEMATIAHVSRSRVIAKQICRKLQEVIPPKLFLISIQAKIGGKIIARENIKAVKKDVLAKCYGGDVTRKMKLLKRQAEGKAKMRLIGNIEVPREAFIKVLKK